MKHHPELQEGLPIVWNFKLVYISTSCNSLCYLFDNYAKIYMYSVCLKYFLLFKVRGNVTAWHHYRFSCPQMLTQTNSISVLMQRIALKNDQPWEIGDSLIRLLGPISRSSKLDIKDQGHYIALSWVELRPCDLTRNWRTLGRSISEQTEETQH